MRLLMKGMRMALLAILVCQVYKQPKTFVDTGGTHLRGRAIYPSRSRGIYKGLGHAFGTLHLYLYRGAECNLMS